MSEYAKRDAVCLLIEGILYDAGGSIPIREMAGKLAPHGIITQTDRVMAINNAVECGVITLDDEMDYAVNPYGRPELAKACAERKQEMMGSPVTIR